MSRHEQYPECKGFETYFAQDGRLVAMVVRSDMESLALFPPFFGPEAAGDPGHPVPAIDLERERNAKAQLTPPEFPLQITMINRDPDKVIWPHYHKVCASPSGTIRHQIMLTLRGRMRVGVYTAAGEHLADVVVEPGDLILLTEGHKIEFLEPRTKVIEIRQGPVPAGGADESTPLEG